jgi:hypothetical protein
VDDFAANFSKRRLVGKRAARRGQRLFGPFGAISPTHRDAAPLLGAKFGPMSASHGRNLSDYADAHKRGANWSFCVH